MKLRFLKAFLALWYDRPLSIQMYPFCQREQKSSVSIGFIAPTTQLTPAIFSRGYLGKQCDRYYPRPEFRDYSQHYTTVGTRQCRVPTLYLYFTQGRNAKACRRQLGNELSRVWCLAWLEFALAKCRYRTLPNEFVLQCKQHEQLLYQWFRLFRRRWQE